MYISSMCPKQCVYDIEVRLRRTADAQIAQLGRETARESRGATVATVRRARSTHDGAAPRRAPGGRAGDLNGFDGPPQPSARTLVNVRSNVNMSFDCCGFNKSGNRNSPSPGVYPLIRLSWTSRHWVSQRVMQCAPPRNGTNHVMAPITQDKFARDTNAHCVWASVRYA